MEKLDLKRTRNKKFFIFYYFMIIIVLLLMTKFLSGDYMDDDEFELSTATLKPKPTLRYTINATSMSVSYAEISPISYYPNNKWMFNNNLMQFSAYLIIDADNKYIVESMVYVIGDPSIDNTMCIMYFKQYNELIMLKPQYLYKTAIPAVRKLVFKFETIKAKLNESDIHIAIILNNDFVFDTEANLTQILAQGSFPSYMINYQVPTIIKVENPRLPKVGICLNYVSHVYEGIKSWVQLHKEFQAAELIMHDGTPARTLKTLLKDYDKSFLTIHDYHFEVQTNCNTEQIQAYKNVYPNAFQTYVQKCHGVHQGTIDQFSGNHNHLTPNDCYIALSYRYEFITLYDLDELLFPKRYKAYDLYDKNESLTCQDKNKICKSEALTLSMYDYLKKLINENFEHPINRLRSIFLYHAAYFLVDDVQISLIKRIKALVQQLENAKGTNLTFTYPIRINILEGSGHVFTVAENETDYLIYLAKQYDVYYCLYEKYIKNIQNFDPSLFRFFYFDTGPHIRLPKSVHYTPNVYSLFTHEAIDYHKDSLILHAPTKDGHLNSHFRLDLSVFYHSGRETSIKTLVFDYEYVSFLLKSRTDYCK